MNLYSNNRKKNCFEQLLLAFQTNFWVLQGTFEGAMAVHHDVPVPEGQTLIRTATRTSTIVTDTKTQQIIFIL